MNTLIPRIGILMCILIFSNHSSAEGESVASTDKDIQTFADQAMAAWEDTLARFVDDQGRTDFTSLANDTQNLQLFVSFVNEVSPRSHPDQFPSRNDVLAYHINAYNALAMMGVIERGIPDNFSSFFKRASFFKFRKIIVGGKKTSLYDYENKVIRPLDEPRIHFALNCMVRDCPRLPKEPFYAARLDEQLDAVTREFFSKPIHFRVEASEKSVYVSSILDFYTKDFVPSGKPRDLAKYFNAYVEEQVPEHFKVRFIDYDWTVNHQPK
ncbi:MAG: DUF547 domain-containing protein [Pseudomonadota bacterium]